MRNYRLLLGYNLFKDFCENDSEEPIQQFKFYEQVNIIIIQLIYKSHTICIIYFLICSFLQIKQFEKTECYDERKKMAREIYDNFIMEELLTHTYVGIL